MWRAFCQVLLCCKHTITELDRWVCAGGANLSVEGEGETEICLRFSEDTRSCRVWPISQSWPTVQLRSTEPSSSSASSCCSSVWICCPRQRLRSLRSASLRCSSAISPCTGVSSISMSHHWCCHLCISHSFHHPSASGMYINELKTPVSIGMKLSDKKQHINPLSTLQCKCFNVIIFLSFKVWSDGNSAAKLNQISHIWATDVFDNSCWGEFYLHQSSFLDEAIPPKQRPLHRITLLHCVRRRTLPDNQPQDTVTQNIPKWYKCMIYTSNKLK